MQSANAPSPLAPETILQIERFCGDCHPLPLPETFPREHWEEEVIQGYDLYIASRRTDLVEPSRQDAIRYYTDAAPDTVFVPRADSLPVYESSTRLERAPLEIAGLGKTSSISHLIRGSKPSQFYSADMRQGAIHRWTIATDGQLTSEQIGRGRHSCRLTLCDWNQDGQDDLLVGEIGSYGVGDHSNGRVSLLRSQEGGGYQQIVLADKLARVVECQLIDYDGDGDRDVLVAEFGWLETGAVKLLRNQGEVDGEPKFTVEVLDPRHGALGVRVLDMNDDGLDDYVIAFGQEYESIEIWTNQGEGQFSHQVILELPDPSYNSSSFDLVDIDQDGLVDILHTNGDTLDAFLPKPYHGVRWVRNLGDGNWVAHELGLLIGALHASAIDFDQDGDLDIVGVGMYPFASQDPGAYDSVCWWEQGPDLAFTQHSIERDHCDYASFLLTDINGDDRVDLILGNWTVGPEEAPLRVYLNFPSQLK
ncbi:FG-GAP repeat domain-containing protein [Planctomycetaceae bacterium SH139]